VKINDQYIGPIVNTNLQRKSSFGTSSHLQRFEFLSYKEWKGQTRKCHTESKNNTTATLLE